MQPAAILNVIVKAEGVAQTNAKLATVQKQLEGTRASAVAAGASFSRAGAAMQMTGAKLTKYVTVPMVAIGAVAGKMAMDYEKAMKMISTQAGASHEEMVKLKKSVLALSASGKVKQSPKELAEGLYRIRSAGFEGRQAMKLLKQSADFATLGQANLEDTTYALVAALKTGIKGTGSMKQAMGTLNAIIGQGNMRMEDLNGAMRSGFLVTATQVGVSLRQVGAALDMMTSQGIPANVAATRMRMTLLLMTGSTTKTAEALESVGLQNDALAKKMQSPSGLIGALRLLKQHMQGLSKVEQTQFLVKAFGGAKSGTTMMALVQNLDEVEKKFRLIGETSGEVGKKVKEALGSKAFAIESAIARIETLLVRIGETVLPIVADAMTKLGDGLSYISDKIEGLAPPIKEAIGLGAVWVAALGPVMWIMGKITSLIGAAIIKMGLFGTGMEVAGAKGAGSFVTGFKYAVPAALAAIGLVNILDSVLKGDFKSAGWKLGGALAGGLAGFVIGGPLGAMVGVGLGSIVGGIFSNIFDHTSRAQQQIQKASQAVREAYHRWKSAAGSIAPAQKRVTEATRHAHKAVHNLTVQERKLSELRREGGATTHQTITQEAKVAEAAARATRAIKNQRVQRMLLRLAEKTNNMGIRETVATTKRQIALEQKHLQHLAKLAQKEGYTKEIREKIAAANKRMGEAQEKQTEALKAAGAINKNWADRLRKMSTAQANYGEHLKAMPRAMKLFTESTNEGLATMGAHEGSWIKAVRANRRLYKHDMTEMSKATGLSVKTIERLLNKSLESMGVAPITFGHQPSGKRGAPGKARGGMVVPGAGTGDKVPLTAMVEPGEVVHVLNKRAAKDRRKLGLLERVNNETPRFAKGGTLSAGSVSAAMGAASRIDAKHFPYVWGGGHGSFGGPYDCSGAVSAVLHAAGLLPRPMVSGELAHYGKAGPGPITIFANDTHTFMRIGNRYFGTSSTNPGGGAGFFPADAQSRAGYAVRHPAGIVAASLPQIEFTGPPGALTSVGAAATEKVQNAANKYFRDHMPGGWGGGDAMLKPGGRIVGASTYGANHSTGTVGAAGVDLRGKNAFAELGMGRFLGHLPFWTRMLISHGGQSVIGRKLDIGLGGDPVKGHRRDIDLYYQTAEALGLPGNWLGLVKVKKLAEGGAVDAKGKKHKTTDPRLSKAAPLGNTQRHKRMLKRIKAIKGYGLPEWMVGTMTELSNEAEKYNEYAMNAQTIAGLSGVENAIGSFKGQTEITWVEEELKALLWLRNWLIRAERIVSRKVQKVARLKARAEEAVRQLTQTVKKLERQTDRLKRSLITAKNKGEAGRAHAIEDQLWRVGLMTTNAKGRLRDAKSYLSALTTQGTNLATTLTDITGDGGDKFRGLKAVQGMDGPMNLMTTAPPLGSVGGDILNAQVTLQNFNIKPDIGSVGTGTEAGEYEKAMALQWMQKALVSQAELAVIRAFPIVGAYASGGTLRTGGLALVGERGPELAALPRGTNIYPNGASPGVNLVIEELTIHEDGRVTVKTGGEELEAEVRRINRKQTRIRPTPGGKR